MTCRGYDPKSIKVSKSVKRVAATLTNSEQRRSLIKSYARVEEVLARTKTSRNRGDRAE
jgi:hypothetical protein